MSEPNSLAQAITEQAVRNLAGERYYARGLDYFLRGHVASFEVWEETIHAVVSGTEDYSVEIAAHRGGLGFSCDCPLGDDDEFCKHLVATALAWLDRQGATVSGEAVGKFNRKPGKNSAAPITPQQIAEALRAEDHATLVDMVIEWARDDSALRTRLRQHTALAIGPETAVREIRRSLEKAIGVRGYVSYDAVGGYVGRVSSAIDSVEKLLAGAHAAPVIELCEAALRSLASAIGNVDDSDGQMTWLMERLQEIHLRACEAARPEPVDLAKRLFRAEMSAEYDQFHGSAERYAGVLGATGLDAFRKLAEAEWAKVAPRSSQERGGEHRGERRDRYAITSIMTSLARQSGDVEQLVSVLERDLASAYDYLGIAKEYRQAGKPDKALEWAERGMAAFPAKTDSRLRLFTAEEYQRLGRHPDALRIVWLDFQDHPGLDPFKLLERFARADDDWDEWRERALRHIRRELSARPAQRRPGAMISSWADRPRDHSLLVEIFLYERNLNDAWREASAGSCSDDLWLRLAQATEKEKPEESAPVYLRLAESNIVNGRGHRYDEAVRLLEQAGRLQRACGKSGEFRRHLDSLCQKYKPKRNFQKLVEERRRYLYAE